MKVHIHPEINLIKGTWQRQKLDSDVITAVYVGIFDFPIFTGFGAHQIPDSSII